MRFAWGAIMIAIAVPLGAAQRPPSFEVASVKPNPVVAPATLGLQPGGRFAARSAPLRQLMLMAYQVQSLQLVGGPDWIRTERFDIEARAGAALPLFVPPGSPNPLHAMLRTLLAERFKLVVHTERQELPLYAMVLARQGQLGPSLRRVTTDCAAVSAANGGQLPAAAPGERPTCALSLGFGRLTAGAVSLAELATALSPQLNRVVADRTGLTGLFDVDLQWTPDNLPPRPAGAPADQPIRVNGFDIDPNGPSLITALREQLGLRLDSVRATVDVIVIDSVERPTPD